MPGSHVYPGMCSVKKKLILIILVSLIGTALSALSLYQFVSLHMGSQHESSFCSISEHVNCEQVHMSDWSSIGGVPLASFGLGFYLLMIVVALLGMSGQVLRREESRDFITVSAFLASLSSVALFLISELKIGALCPVCLAMYLTNFILLGLSWSIPSGEGLAGRVRHAFRAGFRLLGIWIPGKVGFSELLVRIITIFGLCLVLASVISSKFLFTQLYISNQPAEVDVRGDQLRALTVPYVKAWQEEAVVDLPILRNQIVAGDFTKGKEAAPIKIIEFSDFECPHCQKLGTALAQMVKEYPDSIEVVHRDFPLDQSCNRFSGPLHRGACKAAEFARCAGEQGKFWGVAELFFLSGIPEGSTERVIENKIFKEVEALGLDEGPMRECLSSGRHMVKIKQDIESGDTLKIQGTPAVWINGRYVKTPHPDVIREIIEKLKDESSR